MKISIVIPAFNEEKWISGTLEALLLQDYKDFEVIVVDNNSTDATSRVVSGYPNVRLLLEKRAGVQYAREAGRLEARGEIIVNLDADCIVTKDWITKAIKYFDDPQVVAVSGPYDYYDASPFLRVFFTVIQRVVYKTLHFIGSKIFHRGGVLTGGNVFIRSSSLKKIGGYNTSIAFYGDDTDTGNRLLTLGKVLYKNDLCVKSSSRRFSRLGLFKVFYKYTINFIWVSIFNKPYHTKYE